MIAGQPDAWATLLDRSLPIEQAVLGACLIYPDTIDAAVDAVASSDFIEPAHRLLFDRLAEARREGRRVDVGLLRVAVGDSAGVDLGGVTLSEYIARLAGQAPVPESVREHVRALRDFSDYRALYSAAEALREKAALGMAAGLPKALGIDAIAEIDRVVTSQMPEHLRRVSAGDAASSAFAKMERARAGEATARGAPYGVPQLDRMTFGMHPGHLTIVAARPSMGKSAFGVCAALAAAKAGHPCLFVSLEMSAEELAERAISNIASLSGSPIAYTDIRTGNLGDDQVARVEAAVGRLQRLPLAIEQQPGLSPGQIVTRARNAAQRLARSGRKLDVVIVDHLGKVRPSDRYAGNRTTELGEITGAMKDMAIELGCAVIVLCQLNRQTEQRDNKRPTLGDLRESGRIEEDADNVLLLYREAYYLERTKRDGESAFDRQTRIGEVAHDLEIIVAKQRQGETGVVEAWCDMASNTIQGRAA
ncbi:replicative DNA helicase [Methylopila jiangsuensis]|uniref:DNA 5'-3' helicase n=1 Tax=Methylopila jiangsuensis TaxID=586230 RepID=A0A9W6JKE6_9HYPH|nr:DnaB-like helicase C-terminal domain-containing protein [Methylopila jiangsuensis]MDR6284590.1 replicative DNA helicase [Methylopila jiangsuensis]GLK78021.1 replicative DNA helicase [Methylopila jiangsuensis]